MVWIKTEIDVEENAIGTENVTDETEDVLGQEVDLMRDVVVVEGNDQDLEIDIDHLDRIKDHDQEKEDDDQDRIQKKGGIKETNNFKLCKVSSRVEIFIEIMLIGQMYFINHF